MVIVDVGFQLLYKVAYRLMRVYWRLVHPETHGALVAIWHRGRILLVKNSYVPYWSLPGGYVARGETSLQAALRELREEVGMEVSPEALKLSYEIKHDWEGKKDHVEIFEMEVDTPPSVAVDRREVVAAELFSPEQARAMSIFPPIRSHIDLRTRAARNGA